MGNQTFAFGRRVIGQDDGGNISFWTGQIGANTSRIPACWDELLDWTHDASQIFELYLQIRNAEEERVENRRGKVSRGTELQFVPYAFKSKAESIRNLPSMKYLDRVEFFGENVIIAVVESGRPPGILTVRKFAILYTILSRYLDLLILMKSKTPEGRKDECSICLGNDSNTIVLSCSHQLCSNCFDQWVSRRLSCPYCRHAFQPKTVKNNPWEMLDFHADDVLKDVQRMENKLERFWITLDFSTTSPGLLEAYVTKEPTIKVREENGVVIVDS